MPPAGRGSARGAPLSSYMVRPSGKPGPDAAPATPPPVAAPAAAPGGRLAPLNGAAVAPAHVEVRTEHLRKAFGEHLVLDDISLRINTGDIVTIVGSSGSGKTVMLDCLTGLMEP